VTPKSLPIVLFLLLASACSPKPSPAPTPPRPGNLAAPCPTLPDPPTPLIDPARLEYEVMIVALYGECAAKAAAGR
jgi:hypothetical protein